MAKKTKITTIKPKNDKSDSKAYLILIREDEELNQDQVNYYKKKYPIAIIFPVWILKTKVYEIPYRIWEDYYRRFDSAKKWDTLILSQMGRVANAQKEARKKAIINDDIKRRIEDLGL